jgi:hypothetical protein
MGCFKQTAVRGQNVEAKLRQAQPQKQAANRANQKFVERKRLRS